MSQRDMNPVRSGNYATPARSAEAPLLSDRNLHVVFGVTLMAVLGVASVTPAFPAIADALDLSPGAVGLLVVFFTLPGIVLTPVAGVLGDRLGRKRVLVPALVLFAVAGASCGFARNFELLLALRFLQGVGAAALGVINVTIIGDLYQGPRRPAALGYNASVLSVGTAVYPVVGGALTLLGWYYPFFLPILALPVALLVIRHLENPETAPTLSLGVYIRNALASAAKPEALGWFVASLVTFVILYGAVLTYLPFLLAESFGASPAGIGVMLSASSLATVATASQLGWLARRFSQRSLVITGFLCYAASMIGIAFEGNVWIVLAAMMLFGAANGINIPSILGALTELAPAEYRAAFMSLNGMLLRLGQTVGPLVAGWLLHRWGLTGIYIGNAILAVVALVLVAALVRERHGR